ncbi:hypothetical protein ACGK9U_01415 [Mariniflexile sp. HNIBRBA6329]|uniref:hypothetical protein n=1 Tax=Mariniflexile sp. HNIBRBA6329 TaxID=3373088 RepID=UPI003744C08A
MIQSDTNTNTQNPVGWCTTGKLPQITRLKNYMVLATQLYHQPTPINIQWVCT